MVFLHSGAFDTFIRAGACVQSLFALVRKPYCSPASPCLYSNPSDRLPAAACLPGQLKIFHYYSSHINIWPDILVNF